MKVYLKNESFRTWSANVGCCIVGWISFLGFNDGGLKISFEIGGIVVGDGADVPDAIAAGDDDDD